MREFAKRLKELREYKELSLFELSKQIGIGASSLCRWENGQSDIKSDHLIDLAKFFNVTVGYLVGTEDL